MLIAKLTLVPLFIAIVTFAGQRWGHRVAGLLGGLPVVAGPIVILLSLEQGIEFGAQASLAAMAAVSCLLGFGIAYSWAGIYWRWPVALMLATATWFALAMSLSFVFSLVSQQLLVALPCAIIALIATPFCLPKLHLTQTRQAAKSHIVYRMLTATALVLGITGTAKLLGETWSGLLAVFPVIGLVLALFTHQSHGAGHVAQVFRGMVRGLYSFVGFFLTLHFLLPMFGLLVAALAATFFALLIQGFIQFVKSYAKFVF